MDHWWILVPLVLPLNDVQIKIFLPTVVQNIIDTLKIELKFDFE